MATGDAEVDSVANSSNVETSGPRAAASSGGEAIDTKLSKADGVPAIVFAEGAILGESLEHLVHCNDDGASSSYLYGDSEDGEMVECMSSLVGGVAEQDNRSHRNDDDYFVGEDGADGGQQQPFPRQADLVVLPPQLHPAVSAGMTRVSSMSKVSSVQRVSSCYFSIKSSASEASMSAADLLQLLDVENEARDGSMDPSQHRRTCIDANHHNDNINMPEMIRCSDDLRVAAMEDRSLDQAEGNSNKTLDKPAASAFIQQSEKKSDEQNAEDVKLNAADVLYHDIMMHVFSFLDAQSLSAFSETARRPNFECFYFLQLQLQRALLIAPYHNNQNLIGREFQNDDVGRSSRQYFDSLSTIAGSWSISRLATIDPNVAERIVQEYLNSNSTLRTMPLSHSLAYMRHVLHMRLQHMPEAPPPKTVAKAAVVVTLLGAASYMSGSTEHTVALSQGLFKVGLAGSLMKAGVSAREAAKKNSGQEDDSMGDGTTGGNGRISMREAAEHMSRMVQEHMPHFPAHPFPHFPASILPGSSGQHEPNTELNDSQDPHHSTFPSSIAARLYSAFIAANASDDSTDPSLVGSISRSDLARREISSNTTAAAEESSNGLINESEARRPTRRVRSQRSHYRGSAGRRISAVRAGSTENLLERVDEAFPSPETCATHREGAEDSLEGESNEGEGGGEDDPSSLNALSLPTHLLGPRQTTLPDEGHDDVSNSLMGLALSPNPYDHFPVAGIVEETRAGSCKGGDDFLTVARKDNSSIEALKKSPTGCVGAYTRAVRQAVNEITQKIKNKRLAKYEALTDDEKQQISTAFIDACASDENLHVVKDLVQNRNTIDVDGFYIGSDGTETCGLHTAAFNGACKVVEFLSGGIDESDPNEDGGLCNIDLRDANGWTALHFAAGANSVPAVRILAGRGAQLAVEAGNGYTPFHWAERLSNDEVAEELRQLGANNRFWMFGSSIHSSRQNFFANRFFSLIPTH